MRTIGPKKGRYSLRIHREIMCAKKGELVDHINGNTLDNRKENLRLANKSTNGMNRGKQSNNTSGYKGVTFHKQLNKWMPQITINGKRIYLGVYDDVKKAANVYNEAAEKYFKEIKPNEPDGWYRDILNSIEE